MPSRRAETSSLRSDECATLLLHIAPNVKRDGRVCSGVLAAFSCVYVSKRLRQF